MTKLELTVENVIEVLFQRISEINDEFINELSIDMSRDTLKTIENAYEHKMKCAYQEFTEQTGYSQHEVDEFIHNNRLVYSDVYNEIEKVISNVNLSYEMGCLISAEFTPTPDYSEIANVFESYGITDVNVLRIFFEDDEEWNSFSSICEYEINKHKIK